MASLRKRGSVYYAQYYQGGKQKRVSLGTSCKQIAKEKMRRLESAVAQGENNSLPTRTSLANVLTAYVRHIRAVKRPKSAQSDIYYLREVFGPVCEALTITSRMPSAKARKRPAKTAASDRRKKLPVIEASVFEAITPAQIREFIDFKVRDQGLKPKTANHYRSILRRLFNWGQQEYGLRLPSGNPAAQVRPYKLPAAEIRYLTLPQIEEQLHALRFKPQLQTMVAVLIYAGLRREELLCLTIADIDWRKRNGGQGMIHIRAKTVNGEFWQPKTRQNRSVPISQTLRPYLQQYMAPASDLASGADWYFPSPEGHWWDPDNFAHHLRQVNREAGLPWTCLDYRHTFGSQLAQNGVSLHKIATLMGNSPEICRRHYAALSPEAMAGEVDF